MKKIYICNIYSKILSHRIFLLYLLSNMEQCTKKLKLDNETSTPPSTITEGKAEILVNNTNVFYNPVQEFNRDLSVLALMTYVKDKTEQVLETNKDKLTGITLLEALSATGLRSIRYAKEVEGIKQIVANDISAKAVESLKKNIEHNKVEHIIKPNQEDATLLMYQCRRNRFDVIDLDPYGCPTPFLDGAVQCVSDGGLLMVTATDMAVLAGNVPETCYLKYGAISLKSKACHEMALRILLQNIATHAGRYGRYIIPLLSISADFYIRVFVKIFSSQIKCKENATKIGRVYQCTGCESITTQPLCYKQLTGGYKLLQSPGTDKFCLVCHRKQQEGGPMWLGPLHDQQFVSTLLCNLDDVELKTSKRIHGILNVVREELDVPLYYTIDRLMSIVKCITPPMLVFRSALLNAGFNVSYSHACKTSIKTDAPNSVIWDIVRAWEKRNPVTPNRLPDNSPGKWILKKPIDTDVSFEYHPLANPVSRQNKLTRFQQNPIVNWGPGTRAKTRINLVSETETSKKIKNQNKNSKKEKAQITENSEGEKAV
ncbi:tRNA (guanine(26)-N(2))-dimethyltransferase [Osmia lignaria lignaria]|uniref:tRNA (guanine(26)-N(2))-dimethyltransferase n=1 Tax=Osmia lignaria lignaria TaxID=1437193 RepID=UPI00402BA572